MKAHIQWTLFLIIISGNEGSFCFQQRLESYKKWFVFCHMLGVVLNKASIIFVVLDLEPRNEAKDVKTKCKISLYIFSF